MINWFIYGQRVLIDGSSSSGVVWCGVGWGEA